MTWVHWLCVALFPGYVLWDHIFAKWLPWWLRYSTTITNALWLVTVLAGEERSSHVVFWVFMALWIVTRWLASKNRDNNNDLKKAESAEAARLTEVQETSFRREATEAV